MINPFVLNTVAADLLFQYTMAIVYNMLTKHNCLQDIRPLRLSLSISLSLSLSMCLFSGLSQLCDWKSDKKEGIQFSCGPHGIQIIVQGIPGLHVHMLSSKPRLRLSSIKQMKHNLLLKYLTLSKLSVSMEQLSDGDSKPGQQLHS